MHLMFKTVDFPNNTGPILPDTIYDIDSLKFHLKQIEGKIHGIILQSPTAASITGLAVEDYTVLNNRMDTIRNTKDTLTREIKTGLDITEEEEKTTKIILHLKCIEIYKIGKCEEFLLLAYKYVLQNKAIKQLITDSNEFEVKIIAIQHRYTSSANHILMQLTYRDEVLFWDVQHKFFTNDRNQLKYVDRDVRKNFLKVINWIQFQLIDITDNFSFYPIDKPALKSAIKVKEKAILQQREEQEEKESEWDDVLNQQQRSNCSHIL